MGGDSDERLRRRLAAAEDRLETLQMFADSGQYQASLNQARQEVVYLRRLLAAAGGDPDRGLRRVSAPVHALR
ncbi:hypothetical protein DLJ53_12240 [Acuticoccus sediminis]|uniref:Uncharacterized protein n=1 Tax=Acuticoccus sediminis TaxID=2184697 RepID=A0A8B2NXP6_9HYPH|nr:hypothetical protein [Acuticoccus sediminis]RAI02132.1 hypothetical protein DLJ53_12240 [Acuticoccus sediminis]